ncbi:MULTISPECIES: NUDIX domain-containing protein [unclassified Lactobacillus]|uniref:NUDIX domain-containing protein n=1 Tax=unclassified Lactobacillus TaxID=2620435 RepID=UPI00226AA581|nr:MULTISPECIES: NUDIX domain-containing protein [unclassified Lactobacillus]MCX8720375.1 NUDIX domain-containing protein [Lactobacillus sp. B4010]MCX8732806.1 NUDIX domain-containing protein [Lactobacillus sp. B4015]MCX8735141.1 NUDIX domain-containing protein [Lactobacillus sp. B4012]
MRARVIIYNPDLTAILLIHRQKKQRNYWVVPGGGAKRSETPRETAIREINEELRIELTPAQLRQLFVIDDEYFFLTDYRQKAVPDISGEEKERSTSTNVYRPAWVSLSELLKINLMPPALSKKILAVIK